LHEVVTDAGTESPAGSADVRLDALEVGPADDDPVQLQRVTHDGKLTLDGTAMEAMRRAEKRQSRVSASSSSWIVLRLQRLVELGLLR
jgi:hypothetical protein